MTECGELSPPKERRRTLRIAHHHPGRLRVRADSFASDREAIERTRAAIVAMAGVRDVAHEPRTGSFLIHYDPGTIDVNAVIERIADKGNLQLHRAEADEPPNM